MAGVAVAPRLLVLLLAVVGLPAAGALGVNWGTMASHQLPASTVVRMLQDNGIRKVKLFDADAEPLGALAGSGIEVMVAIPNNMLDMMTDYDTAREWVHKNVSAYNFGGGVNIRYVAVGNEPFLTSLNGTFLNVTLPALQNIQRALDEAGVGDTVKATVPLNADVYESPKDNPVPSAGRFRAEISGLMTEIVQFLNQSGAPFTVNIYPYLSLYGNDAFPLDFAFFDGASSPVVDGNIQYTNVFDANFDTLVSALAAAGVAGLPVVVGEVGWPTDGEKHATAAYAQRFYAGLFRKLAGNAGTPLRPNQYIEIYLFSLIDEDVKSIAPGNFERHWGVMRYDGQPKYAMDPTGQGRNTALTGARGVEYLPRAWCVLNTNSPPENMSRLADNIGYACTYGADCTSLGYGSTCNGMDAAGNASYAFNAYFQVQDQDEEACGFDGLAVRTRQDPSTGTCNFTIQLETASAAGRSTTLLTTALLLASVLAAMVTTL